MPLLNFNSVIAFDGNLNIRGELEMQSAIVHGDVFRDKSFAQILSNFSFLFTAWWNNLTTH